MTTFKQFLEAQVDDLDLLRYELFFQKEMHLSKRAAKAAVVWAKKAGEIGAPSPTTIPDDGWDHITDWADDLHRKTTGMSIYGGSADGGGRGRKNPFDLQLMVKGLIAREMRNRYRLELMAAPISESTDDLEELTFELALRKEFGCSKEQAKELVLWLKGDKDWEDLDHDARGPIISRFDPDEDDVHPMMSYDDWTMDQVSDILRDKYHLDTRDLV